MIRLYLLILTLCLVTFSNGCGGNGTTVANSNGNSAVVINQNTSRNLNAENNPVNANAGFPNMNSDVPVTPNIPANVAVKDDPTGKMKGQMPTASASDNSEVTTALGENLVQTRVFRNHPQIAKIESVTILGGGGEKKTFKVYLKNGQVRELPEGKVKDAMTEPAANILKAIG